MHAANWITANLAPAPSQWAAFVAEGAAVSNSRPLPKPAVKAALEPAAKPRPKLPERAVGLASVFGQWHHPQCIASADAGTYQQKLTMIRAGAFDEQLADVRAGRAVIELRVDHRKGSGQCSTHDGSLELWTDDEGLWVRIHSTTRDGRRALDFIRAHREYGELSIGCDRVLVMEDGPTPGAVTRADLTEVSLVKDGACPGTWIGIAGRR